MLKSYAYLDQPVIIEEDGIVKKVNKAFLELSCFCKEELLHMPFRTIWTDNLKIFIDPDILDEKKQVHLFTKDLDARRVNVKRYPYDKGFAYILEDSISTPENSIQLLERLLDDNVMGIGVYSIPDYILIKANQRYLDYLPFPYNSNDVSYGKPLKDIIVDFEGSRGEQVWNDMVTNNKSQYVKEKQGLMIDKDNKYWDNMLTPIAENGEVKYIVSMLDDVTERVMSREHIKRQARIIEQQKEELKEKSLQLTTILENINDAICLFNNEGKVIFANRATRDYFRAREFYDPEIAISCIKYFDENDNELTFEELPLAKALKGEHIPSTIIKSVYKDEVLYVDVSAIPIFTKKCELEFVLTVNRDMSEILLVQQQLFYENKKLETIIDNISDGLIVIDKQGKFIIVNKAFKKIMEQKSSIATTVEQVGETIKKGQIYYDEYGKELSLQDLPSIKVLKGEKVDNQRIVVIKDSIESHIDFSATPVFDDNGDFLYGVIVNHDVTNLVLKDKEIKTQKEQLEIILENMTEALFVYDRDGKFVMINNAGRQFIDKPISKAGDTLEIFEYFDLDGNKLRFEDLPSYHVLQGRTVPELIMNMKSPYVDKYVSFRGCPIFEVEKKLLYAVVTSRDVTEMIKYQKAIKDQQDMLLRVEKEKNEALEETMKFKDEFLYLITHEFRTPMAVVNSAIQAINLLYRSEVTSNVGKYLNTIKQNTNRQLRLVNNLLDISKINSGQIKINLHLFDSVYLTKSIVNSVEVYAQQKGVKIYFKSNISKKLMLLDEEKYERIILNLLANALKFTPTGKNIYVEMKYKKSKDLNVLSVCVKDEGIGIPKDRQKIIFEKFGQADTSLSRQAEGIGLGLHLVRLLVDAFQGEINLESEEGKGCAFTVLFPVIEAKSEDEIAVCTEMNGLPEIVDDRLIQSIAIEFSDIYF